MKKLGILLILLMFVICSIAGFKAAETYYQMQPTATPLSGRRDHQSQQTLFLLHVDQLKTPKPVLKSVWALFLYYSNSPSMTFVPLYQRNSAMGRILPLRDFSLSAEGDISDAFLQTLQKQFDLTTGDYVVLDDQALIIFGKRFDSAQPDGQQATPGENDAVEQMCAYMQTTESKVNGNLPWEQVLPDHFRTNMRFDLFQAIWLRLNAGEARPICEIIPRH